MEPTGQNKRDVPKLNLSLSDRERARLERLAKIRGANFNRVVSEAVVHILASLELSEPIHYVVPSEQHEGEQQS